MRERKPRVPKYTDPDIRAARKKDAARIAAEIDHIRASQNVSALEASMLYCERHGVEPDLIAPAIRQNPRLRNVLAQDAVSLRLLKVD
jgi:hypothetical protein